MKRSFFPRLAWLGIQKNRRLYVPYIITAIGMVMMLYIVQSLSYAPAIRAIPHSGDIEMVLSLGKYVIAIFALIFLFYTNSFLIRRRNREFGLYNILGMDKYGIYRVIFWETLMIGTVSTVLGLFFGIAFSKLTELGLVNVVHAEVTMSVSVPKEAVLFTLEIFGGIFFVLLLRSLWSVGRARPMELLKSESYGEKPPKANWLLAGVGVGLLAWAYYLAVSIKSPITAMVLFFIAVVMVIIATYLLFVAGSVTLCRLLQKNKRYYYRKNHFVSVSSMAYRMKRNGAGLASICILATMVLVMISSTSSLYFGANDAIRSRFPRENEMSVMVDSPQKLSEETVAIIKDTFAGIFASHGVTPTVEESYRFASIAALQTGDRFEADVNGQQFNTIQSFDNVRNIFFITLEDYNRLTQNHYRLGEGEALLAEVRCDYDDDAFRLNDLQLGITHKVDPLEIGQANTQILPSLQLVVADYDVLRPLESLTYESGDLLMNMQCYYGYDLEADDETTIEVFQAAKKALLKNKTLANEWGGYSYNAACMAEEKNSFFVSFGGLFFLGILLSIVFIFAAAMIIYYKQVSEGYEDQARFAIMQKVGMSKEDIRKSINSQILTVFFAPLVFAGLHLAFAFPLIWKILMLFNLRNLWLVVGITAGAFLLFGVFYALIYKVTARAYYTIVLSGGK